jgi:hypothetical protein
MQLSARTAAALEALDAWAAAGEAVLIFVRSLAVQETLSRALSLIYGLPPVPVLNGALTFAARQATVGHVRAGQGFRVLIVSPDVGGAGWNLQFAARSLLYEVARGIDAGLDRKALHGQASMAKLYCSEMAGRVADRAVQIFGGRGYMRENVAERMFRELRVERIWEGASEIQRIIIGRQLMLRGPQAILDSH